MFGVFEVFEGFERFEGFEAWGWKADSRSIFSGWKTWENRSMVSDIGVNRVEFFF